MLVAPSARDVLYLPRFYQIELAFAAKTIRFCASATLTSRKHKAVFRTAIDRDLVPLHVWDLAYRRHVQNITAYYSILTVLTIL